MMLSNPSFILGRTCAYSTPPIKTRSPTWIDNSPRTATIFFSIFSRPSTLCDEFVSSRRGVALSNPQGSNALQRCCPYCVPTLDMWRPNRWTVRTDKVRHRPATYRDSGTWYSTISEHEYPTLEIGHQECLMWPEDVCPVALSPR
jgi:hypothetical protein